jgi:hypothetical protein
MKGYLLNSCGLLIVFSIFAVTLSGQNSKDIQPVKTRYVDAKDFFDPASPTSGLQEAVNHLKPDGGTVYLSPGTYKVRKSIVLFPGVYITGSGEYSVIERADTCVQKPLVAPAKTGDTEIQVDDASGFVRGGEITIFSNTNSGFNSAVAVIKEVKGKTLVLDRALRKDYLTDKRAAVLNFFPAFTMNNGENIRIENLVIDGKMKQGAAYHGDFVYSAIHLVHVSNIFIDKVIIRRYPGDGFSIQGGSNASVTNCVAEYNLGNGFHPGTTLRGSTWSQNTGRFNGGDGLYFCYNVRYATVSGNHFYNNRENGIGDLGKGGEEGDQMNVVSGNFCFNNSKAGIECTPGGNNIVIDNVCENNSKSEPGKYAAISLRDTHSTIVKGNRCSDSASAGKESSGIRLVGKCSSNMITDNIISGYSGGVAGENLESNTVERNISLPPAQ